jgi:hypothetical protein
MCGGGESGRQGIAGLTTGANEHDTVSVLAAVEVVLYRLRQFSAGRAATGTMIKESR